MSGSLIRRRYFASLSRLSMTGCELVLGNTPRAGAQVRITAHLDSGPVVLRGRVVHNALLGDDPETVEVAFQRHDRRASQTLRAVL